MNLLPRPRSASFDGRGVTVAAPDRPPIANVDPSLPAQGYRLSIGEDAVELVGADAAGVAYGRATLAQLARVNGGRLPIGTVEDWPDNLVRGVMLDISRDKVPTMATLEDLIDRLAGWKVNQVQLYAEHTFAYPGHEEVWAKASPVSPEEIQDLDAFCRVRHVELVPNQNCLGHMNRWLRHARYRHLAIAPDGFTDAFGLRRGPMTLDPANPESFTLVRGLLGELLPHFTSRRVHVGLDETWELPDERIGEYVDWVRRLRELPELDGRDMLVWGDILATHPEVLATLPEGLTICEWGYEATSPFAERTAALASAGRPFWVCPGTSSWTSIVGRVTNAIGNCRAAAEAGLAHGATGYLITDWGDMGHLQYLPISEPGFAYGAAVAWCFDANRDLDLAALAGALDGHAFADDTGELSAALLELGDVHRRVGPQVPNMSVLALHLYWPQMRVGGGLNQGMTADDLLAAEATLADAVSRLDRARPARPDADLVLDELRNGAALVALLCRDARARLAGDGKLASVPGRARAALATDLTVILGEHRRLWLARNRPGGLDDSAAWLERLARAYDTGVIDPPPSLA